MPQPSATKRDTNIERGVTIPKWDSYNCNWTLTLYQVSCDKWKISHQYTTIFQDLYHSSVCISKVTDTTYGNNYITKYDAGIKALNDKK